VLRRRVQFALAAAVAALGVVAFLPAVSGGWIYDDRPLIAENPYVHSFAEWPRWFVTDFWNVKAELVQFGVRILYWRPGVSATYALDWTLGGGSPLMFHITNCLLQALACGLAYLVLRRWIGATLPAVAAAALFAVHPTKAESVAWIAGRTDILCMVAVLVASTGFARRRAGKHGGIAMEVGGTIAAYLCKEQAIVLPCFAAIEAWVALDRPALDLGVVRKLVRAAIPQAIIAVGYLVVRTLVLPVSTSEEVGHIPFGDHALAVLETVGRFFTLSVAPHDLSIQQGLVHTEAHVLVHSPAYVAIGVASTIVLVALAWLLRRRQPMIALGIAFYFVTLLPTSNVIYTNMATLISERFLYLPVFGLAFAVGGALLAAHGPARQALYALAIVATSALLAISLARAADYRDENAFWRRELRLHPDSGLARAETFEYYARNHRYYDALALWQEHPPYDVGYDDPLVVGENVAGVMARLVPDHRAKDLEQIDRFCDDVLERRPAKLAMLGVSFQLDPIRSDKAFAKSKQGLFVLRSDLQSRLGHDDAAIELARQGAELCPTCFSLLQPLALALARAGRYDDALAVLASDVHAPEQDLAKTREQIDAARALAEQAAAATGPAALQARASELAKLDLWGRAFDVLAPYEAEIAKAPKFAEGFAELAVRAGEPDVARRVLAATKSPAEASALIAAWTAEMGWAP
jgi:hypothetical protein